ncbi:type II toxin-antitoxin system RelE/ParE family toxin [Methylopila sp. 73B]|uniref:type II toxin-antitoxin system RelE/ParE family toxin n=1 Tax=Methylopila sp. 73B TaxID=1120792 RepID=UPI00037B282D|nr:type II toxin-antitoxin system RelE/ParE family toxin [Methylopila sp. 73B]
MNVRFSRQANRDLEDAYLFHAERNPDQARRLLDDVISAALSLSTFPDRGSPQPNAAGRPFRRLIEKGHVIVYVVDDHGVIVLRIVHGARDLDALFAEFD